MPVSDEDRAAYAKLSDTDRMTAVQSQLKRIREASTGPAMNHEVVNDALDQIEVLAKQPEKPEHPKTKAELAKEKADA